MACLGNNIRFRRDGTAHSEPHYLHVGDRIEQAIAADPGIFAYLLGALAEQVDTRAVACLEFAGDRNQKKADLRVCNQGNICKLVVHTGNAENTCFIPEQRGKR